MHLLSPHSSYASGRRRQGFATAAWWVHLVGAIALIAGLFLPLTGMSAALAAPGNTAATQDQPAQAQPDRVPPPPTQVTAIGDFQQQLGCSAFDASCEQTQLTNNDGVWSGVFAVPPGQYGWQIAAVEPDGSVATYGQGGLGGGAQQVAVGDGAAGIYFRLNTHTNEVTAAPAAGLYTVQINGSPLALEPGSGQLAAIVSSPGGNVSVQVLQNGAPLTDPVPVNLNPGPNRVTFDTGGQLLDVEPLAGGSVTVQRRDASGDPLGGGCYQLRGGNGIVNQACDGGDGAVDGTTVMSFPQGVPGGTVAVVEVTPPDGVEPVAPQDLTLEGGDMVVTLQPTAGETGEDGEETEEDGGAISQGPEGQETGNISQGEEGQVIEASEGTMAPTEPAQAQPGDLIVNLEDQSGAPIPDACLALLQDGATVTERCDTTEYEPADFAGNGTTGFFGVPSGSYTLQLTQAPSGATAEDREVTVPPGGEATETVTVTLAQPTATAAPTETPLPTETPAPTETPLPTETPALTETPQPQPGNLTVTLLNPAGDPLGGACFALLQNGATVAESCDTPEVETAEFANNGNTGFFDIPAGTYTLTMTSAPDGASVEDREVEIAPGGDDVVTITVQTAPSTGVPTGESIVTPTPTATEVSTAPPVVTPTGTAEAQPGDLTVTLVDQNDEPVPGACFTLVQDDTIVAESCDTLEVETAEFANNGNTGFFDVPAGTYTLRMTSGPDGTDVDERQVEIAPGTETTVTVTAQREAPTAEATATATPTVTPGPTPTETAEADEPGPPGDLLVMFEDTGGAPIGNACFRITMEGQAPIVSCDRAQYEQTPGNGTTGFYGVPSGTYDIVQLEDNDTTSPVDPSQVTVEAGTQTSVTVTPAEGGQGGELPGGNAPEIPEGAGGTLNVDVSALDATTICIELNTGGAISLVNPPAACDNGDNDLNDEPGVIGLESVAPGEYTLYVTADDEAVVQQAVTVSADQGTTVTVGAPATPTPTTTPTQVPPTSTPTPTQVPSTSTPSPTPVPPTSTPSPTPVPPTSTPSPTPVPPGAIHVVSQNPGGTPVSGACVAVDNGEPLCDVDDDGILNFDNVAPGQHTVTQTAPPDGYRLPEEATQTVDVAPGETANVTFTNTLATGAIVATVTDGDGNPVPGVCVSYNAGENDLETLCEAGDDGTYRFDDVPPGTYTVSVGQVPEALFVAPEPMQVEVTAGEEATAAFELAPTPPETGSALISLQSEDGQAAAGVCIVLTSQETGDQLGPFCDNDEKDGDATAGVILVQDIPAGTWSVTFPDRQQRAVAAASSEITIDIEVDVTIEVVITVPGLEVLGDIEVRTVDAATGETLPGTCYTIGTDEPITVCDDGDADEATGAGTILVTDVEAGDYPVSLTTVPAGYNGAPDQTATVVAGETATLVFRLEPAVTTGTLTVNKVDEAGDPLAGACFRLEQNGNGVASVCDADDGDDDGTVTFGDIPAGMYQLVESRTPGGGYQAAPDRTVEIVAGESTTVEATNRAAPGRLYVIKVDADDPSTRLEDACFALTGDVSYGPFCDSDDRATDGRIVFNGVAPGDYTLTETQAPAGHDAADDRQVTIRAGVTLQVTVPNEKTPPPPEAGTLVVHKVDADGETLAGGCFRLFDGDRPVTGRACDITDGTNDGRIVFENVPVGTWTLHETLTPSPDYRQAPDQQVTIEDDTTTEVEVVNELKQGRILVNKVTADGRNPVEGACFTLDPAVGEPQCSDASGQILFDDVPAGSYTLSETTVPYGFKQAEPVENIAVHPGQTTVVTVENEHQPPPNTGSVQIRKFVCPVDMQDEEKTTFLGGAAGDAQLAETKGCAPANAEFTLVGQDGADGPGAFATGEDGQYQVTVPAKIYRLDETEPDLPGNSAALLRVDVGKLTTVVVINYVAPPAPEPVDISVAKYTCQAGFNGTTFADFAASCMNASQLTNNITIRAEGPIDLKAVTGDGGEAGRTAFVDQPSGTYTIYEERPYDIPTSYQFCGWDPNAPADFKAVNGSVTAELGEGAQLTCVFFNIPENVTDTTGVVLVRKYTCDVEKPPKGYEFAEECGLSHQNVTFELKPYDAANDSYGEATTLPTNPDGIVRFEGLQPGSYQLREVDANWCYANSNSVNTKGDVVVNAGQVSLVSIYNCVGTQQPPNTGSGDAAALLNGQQPATSSTRDGIGVTPGIAWPAVILGLVAALWPRKVQAPDVDWSREDDPGRDAA